MGSFHSSWLSRVYVHLGMILLSVLFLTGCDSATEPYAMVSITGYNSSLCSNIGYGAATDGFNTGVKFIFKDGNTGEILKGHASIEIDGSVSGVSTDSYTCQEKTLSEQGHVNAYAAGYSPSKFNIAMQSDMMTTSEIYLIKSCSDPVLPENLSVYHSMIDRYFNISSSDYTLTCVEEEAGRGGYVKAKGTFKDGSFMELYYHWGWCSSGGSDCGYSMCFASDGAMFEHVKDRYCNTLSSVQRNSSVSEGMMTLVIVNDTTPDMVRDCLEGKFEEKSDGRRSMAIVQSSNRYADAIMKGNTDCLAN